MHQNVPKLPEKRRFRTVPFLAVHWFFHNRICRVGLPLKSQKKFGTFWNLFSKSILKDFWRIKTRNSWPSRRARLMKIAYLESEDLFTSNGFFKIWNFFLGKIFPIFGQYFVPTLDIGYIIYRSIYLIALYYLFNRVVTVLRILGRQSPTT